jgi:hypothetical protein
MLKAEKQLLWRPDANLDLCPPCTVSRKKCVAIEMKQLKCDSNSYLLSPKISVNTV